eukprot:GHVR01179826.1.p1 GENE.GHVR01179826.1~~GHVR01179826.1.p1  ORF type:complete len:292 (-),score=145.40 GHVR01179826.1:467-1342(-)
MVLQTHKKLINKYDLPDSVALVLRHQLRSLRALSRPNKDVCVSSSGVCVGAPHSGTAQLIVVQIASVCCLLSWSIASFQHYGHAHPSFVSELLELIKYLSLVIVPPICTHTHTHTNICGICSTSFNKINNISGKYITGGCGCGDSDTLSVALLLCSSLVTDKINVKLLHQLLGSSTVHGLLPSLVRGCLVHPDTCVKLPSLLTINNINNNNNNEEDSNNNNILNNINNINNIIGEIDGTEIEGGNRDTHTDTHTHTHTHTQQRQTDEDVLMSNDIHTDNTHTHTHTFKLIS